jgi:hypothetical protein
MLSVKSSAMSLLYERAPPIPEHIRCCPVQRRQLVRGSISGRGVFVRGGSCGCWLLFYCIIAAFGVGIKSSWATIDEQPLQCAPYCCCFIFFFVHVELFFFIYVEDQLKDKI